MRYNKCAAEQQRQCLLLKKDNANNKTHRGWKSKKENKIKNKKDKDPNKLMLIRYV